jgi:hydroxymethylbilane synthase
MRLSSIRIAARQSDLARLQAYRVGEAIQQAFPEIQIRYQFRASLGDINQHDPLWKMPEKGVFTEDFLRDLTEETADLVVHSWKDLPTEPRSQTEIVATLSRADVRDILLFRSDRVEEAARNGVVRILTSSPRRSHNLREFLGEYLPFRSREVRFENVRGNIPTRLRKMLSQDVEGLIVAKAAIDRLLGAPEAEFEEARAVIREALGKSRFMVLPLSVNPTAAAHGALAVEIKKGREDLKEILAKVNCPSTFETVTEERRTLASYGGGCHQKIGINVLRKFYGDVVFLRGLTDAGQVLDGIRLRAPEPVPLAASGRELFPQRNEEAAFFERKTLPKESWSWAEKERFLWVSRETAWPQNFEPMPEAIVWTAGLRTWKRLAERGVWVSGSAESLGEQESEDIGVLATLGRGDQAGLAPIPTPWVKLTHDQSQSGEARICATYRLIAKDKALTPDLALRSHFFWMSGSAFDRALELYPEIRGGHHACGPGNTYQHLRKALGPTASVRIYLSLDAWRTQVTPAAADVIK